MAGDNIRPIVYGRPVSKKSDTEDGRKRRGAASRETALASAIAIAEVEGLEGLSFGRVAREAAMPKSSLQVLFGDRETLQIQTLTSSVDAFASQVRAALAASRIPPSRPLARLCDAWFSTVEGGNCRGGCLLTASVTEYRGRQGAIPAAVQASQTRWSDAMHRAAADAVAAGELAPSSDLDQLVFELLAFQAAANVAAGSGDRLGLQRARDAALARIGRESADRAAA